MANPRPVGGPDPWILSREELAHMAGEDEDDQFDYCYGELSWEGRDLIRKIRDDAYLFAGVTRLIMETSDLDNIPDIGWENLGVYIANNTSLRVIGLVDNGITDEKMAFLFKRLTSKCSPMERVNLSHNSIGIEGIRSMVPFLASNSQNILKLQLNNNSNIYTEGFEMLIRALDGGQIEELHVGSCNIEDISVLGECTLPHLHYLNFTPNNIRIMGSPSSLENYTNLKSLYVGGKRNSGHKIGKDGCITIANLLQKEGSNLTCLGLGSGIDDEGAEIIAAALKRNKILTNLYMNGNLLKERGYRALLKLLNDLSSIKSTYYSNHTLTSINFNNVPDHGSPTLLDIMKHIQLATTINTRPRFAHITNIPFHPGRTKVINTQLDSKTRMKLAQLLGINR